MRYNSLFLATLSLGCALAQPAHHRHHHKQRRNNVNYDLSGVDFNTVSLDLSGVDWKTVDYSATATTSTSVPVVTPSTPAEIPTSNKEAAKAVNVVPVPAAENTTSESASESEPKPVEGTSSSGNGIVSGAKGGAQGSFGGRTTPVVTGDRITYIGNVGVPYGSNMMFIPNDQVNSYKYTTMFKNVGQNPIPINVWNKAGRDGRANSGGCTEANLKFTLNAGESQAVAFDENTQAAFSRDCEKGPGNYPACVWGEMDFGDLRPDDATGAGNKGHSGFDRSSIPGGHGEMLTMSCVDCAGGEQTSSREKNRFTSAAQLSGGGQVNPGPAHFLAELAF
ncbi:MAG: hypothetical protein LQ343_004233 [Gyalolechia ehrenbergii]|nr:MAG: hypothetical protein LQ343_004233 [Gyalolechia ehrenbergii]